MLLEISIFIVSNRMSSVCPFSRSHPCADSQDAETMANTLQTLNQNLPVILRNLEE